MLAAFSVDSVLDNGDGSNITLREAVDAVNLSLDSENSITFDPAVFNTPQTILLTQGELDITKSVTIDTQGQDITIDASGNDPTPNVNNGDGSRVFSISLGISQEPRDVTLAGLTITGGDSSLNGGGLYFDSSAFPSGDVTLTPY